MDMATTTYGAQFRSNSDEIKHYVKKILADGKQHLRKDIMAKIEAITGNTSYTDGQWAGAFQAILKMDGYTSPRTGVYQYEGDLEEQLVSDIEEQVPSVFQECHESLEDSITQLKARINEADLMRKKALDLTTEEFEQVQKLRKLIQQLEEIKSALI